MSKFVDLTGKIFTRWTVIKRGENTKDYKTRWFCKCDCGIEKLVTAGDLNNGNSKSCGCLSKELTIKRQLGKKGSESRCWKGGKYKDQNGYIRVCTSTTPKGGYSFEHTLVMSNYIGRPLIKGETIHHKNGVKDDNRIENLELRCSNHGPGQRVIDLVPYWKNMLATYEPVWDALQEYDK